MVDEPTPDPAPEPTPAPVVDPSVPVLVFPPISVSPEKEIVIPATPERRPNKLLLESLSVQRIGKNYNLDFTLRRGEIDGNGDFDVFGDPISVRVTNILGAVALELHPELQTTVPANLGACIAIATRLGVI